LNNVLKSIEHKSDFKTTAILQSNILRKRSSGGWINRSWLL